VRIEVSGTGSRMKTLRNLAVMALFAGLIGWASACGTLGSRETPAVRVVRGYAPTVVNIRTERVVDLKEYPEWGRYGEQLDTFLKDYYGEDYSKGILKYKSVGSGVILNGAGLIVTNAHVIQKASNIYVVLSDGTVLKAKLVGVSQEDDLAVIRTKLPHPVKAIKFAAMRDLMIGETVIAIGNPFGLENSVTVGVISGKDRDFSSSQCRYVCSGLLQTDASINPGNSGGALFNLDGELVGINLAVVQNAQNIGFAIPANKVDVLLQELK
jgi:serine protease Do